jgi:hypothetical protein
MANDSLPDINNETELTAAADKATTPAEKEHVTKHAHRLGLSHLLHWGKSTDTASTR